MARRVAGGHHARLLRGFRCVRPGFGCGFACEAHGIRCRSCRGLVIAGGKASGKSGGDPSGSSFPVRDGFFCAHLRIFEAHSGHQVNGGVADWRNGDRRLPLQFWKIRSYIHRNPEEAHRGSFPALREPFAVGTEIYGQRPEQLHAVARTRKDVIAGNHRLR